jgi:hypothetical protein
VLTNYLERGSELLVITSRLFVSLGNWPRNPFCHWTLKLFTIPQSSLIHTLIPYLCLTLNITFPSMPMSTKYSVPFTFYNLLYGSLPSNCCLPRQLTFPLFYRPDNIYVTKFLIMQLPPWSYYFHNVYAAFRCVYTCLTSSVHIMFLHKVLTP